jgi:hypothetical protein
MSTFEGTPATAPAFNQIWRRIQGLADAGFSTKTGKAFYSWTPGAVHLGNTSRSLSRAQFLTALQRFPVTGPGALEDLQGPSYLYAILTDLRVTGDS